MICALERGGPALPLVFWRKFFSSSDVAPPSSDSRSNGSMSDVCS